MARSFIESTFLAACPSFEPVWNAHRRMLVAITEPDAAEFFAPLRQHLLGLLESRRVAEFTRVLHTVERLLTNCDPMLEEVLARAFVQPLLAAVELAGATSQVEPYLGPRIRALRTRPLQADPLGEETG